jgi:hypothetical protein
LLSINTSPSSPTVFFPTATWLVSTCEDDGACSYGRQLGWLVLRSEFIYLFFNDSLSLSLASVSQICGDIKKKKKKTSNNMFQITFLIKKKKKKLTFH